MYIFGVLCYNLRLLSPRHTSSVVESYFASESFSMCNSSVSGTWFICSFSHRSSFVVLSCQLFILILFLFGTQCSAWFDCFLILFAFMLALVLFIFQSFNIGWRALPWQNFRVCVCVCVSVCVCVYVCMCHNVCYLIAMFSSHMVTVYSVTFAIFYIYTGCQSCEANQNCSQNAFILFSHNLICILPRCISYGSQFVLCS